MENNFNARWEESQRKKREFDNQLLRLRTMAESAETDLDAIKKEALSEFGTDDLDNLRQHLIQTKQENEAKLSKFEQEVSSFGNALNEITLKLSAYNA